MSHTKPIKTSPDQNRMSAKGQSDADNTAETAASNANGKKPKAFDRWLITRANMRAPEEKEGFYPADYTWLLYRLGQLTASYGKQTSIDRLLDGSGSKDVFQELVGQSKGGSKMDFRQGGPFRGGVHSGVDNEEVRKYYFGRLDVVYEEIVDEKTGKNKKDCTTITGLSDYATQQGLSDAPARYAALWVVKAHCKDFNIHIEKLDKLFDEINEQYDLKTRIVKKQDDSETGAAEGQSTPDNTKEMSDKQLADEQLEKWWGDICVALREKFALCWPPTQGTSVPKEVVESLWDVTAAYASARNLLKKEPYEQEESGTPSISAAEPFISARDEADDSLGYTCPTPPVTLSRLKGELLEQKGRTPPLLACGPFTNIQFVETAFPNEFVALLIAHLGKGAEQEDKALEHAVEGLFEPTRDDEFALAASEHFLQNEGLPFARLVERCDLLCDGADVQAFYDCVEVLFGVEQSESNNELWSGFLNYANGSMARGLAFMVIVALLGTDRQLVIERIVSQRLAQNVHPCN